MKNKIFRNIKALVLVAVSLLLGLSPLCAELRFLPSAKALAAFGIPMGAEHFGEGTFRLPASLRVIEEEAFEGTAASVVALADGAMRVESRAFAHMPEIQAVSLPQSAEQIADDAFDGAMEMTVYGAAGSEAQAWAQRAGYVFVIRNLWTRTALRRLASDFLMLLLLAMMAGEILFLGFSRRRHWNISLTEFQSMLYRKRAELFARDLCFP